MRANVYEVEVVISQVDGYRAGQPKYTKQDIVVSKTEQNAIALVERELKYEIKDIIKNKSYCVEHKCKLLLESVLG